MTRDFADQLSEHHEILAFEEGRLKGLKSALATVRGAAGPDRPLLGERSVRQSTIESLREAIRFTEELLVEMRDDGY